MKVSDLRGILQYIPRFRDKIFVIAMDGRLVESETFANFLLDVAVLRSLNIKIILVHGASHQIERLASERGLKVSSCDGTGVTDDETLRISLDASTRLTHEIMEGLTSVDLRVAVANVVIAHPAGILGGIDSQNTGKVERVDAHCLNLFLNEGIVPVIPPHGFDGEGRTYRVNSEAIAVDVAESVRAAKLIFIGAHEPLLQNGQLVRQLSVVEAEELAKKRGGTVGRVLLHKLECAARACRQGVSRVHLLNGAQDEALLTEIFSNEGIGTMVYSNEYQQVRRVFKKDIRAVMNLIRQSVRNEELVRRTRGDIIASIDDYWVLEIDRNLVGCVALHIFPEESMAELACLYVSKTHENQGYGRILMTFVDNLARERSIKRLFALSTQAYAYLQQKGGFVEASADILPASRREKYEASGRNSRVLVRQVS